MPNTPTKTTKTTKSKLKAGGEIASTLIRKQASQVAKDMADWRNAKRDATRPDFPRRVRISDLVEDLLHDTHLSAQMDLRIEKSLAKPFVILRDRDKIDEQTTQLLQESTAFGDLLELLMTTPFWGHSLIELQYSEGDLFTPILVPRRHVIPGLGLLLVDTCDMDGIRYREIPEYGVSLIEAGAPDDLGILFDCIPDTIFRRCAKASWSEFCEIYGIPPRILKMDTSDTEAFNRAVGMMSRMGANNWAVIDIAEEMEFAASMSDNGAIFQGIIAAAEQSISLKICGAVIGQDTRNGNRSKEESSLKLLESKCNADRKTLTKVVNNAVLPALERLGIIPSGLRFAYPEQEDLETLFARTMQLLPLYEVDPKWLKNKFGVEIMEPRSLSAAGQTLSSSRVTSLEPTTLEVTNSDVEGGDDDFF